MLCHRHARRTKCKRRASGEIPTDVVFESDAVLAFNDIEPQAPKHVVIIPKKHVPTLNDLNSENSGLISELVMAAIQIAKEFKIDVSGFRILSNCNAEGGQLIPHLHFHLLGGRQMGWPPG